MNCAQNRKSRDTESLSWSHSGEYLLVFLESEFNNITLVEPLAKTLSEKL